MPRQAHYNARADHAETISMTKLTPREIDTLACLVSGKSYKSMAILLSVSPKTVESHVHNIMEKLGCHSRERIAEMIERSSLYPFLKKRYLVLLMQEDFKHILQHIAQLGHQSAPTCLIVQPQSSPDSTSLQNLASDLKLAGINVKQGTLKEHSGTDALIYIAPTSVQNPQEGEIQKITDIVQSLEKAKSKPRKMIFLVQGRTLANLPSLPNIHHIFWEDNSPMLTFETLKHLLPTIPVETMTASFKQQWGELINSKDDEFDPTSFRHREEKGGNDYVDLLKSFMQYKRVLWAVIALSVITAGCLLVMGVRTTNVSSQVSTVPVRSDMSIPTGTHLLQRSSLLAKIVEKFKGTEGIQTVVLVGMGGSGKTTLARQYMAAQDWPVVWEINAETQKSLIASFEHLAYALSPNTEERNELYKIKKIDNTQEYIKKLLHFVKQKLKARKQWVLLFDNVEGFSDIEPFLPIDVKTWGAGRILITTRNRYLKDNHHINAKNVISITPLGEQEACELFSKALQRDDEKTAPMTTEQKRKLKKFLKELPPFPLDVTMAARHISSTGMGQDEYLEHLRSPDDGFEQAQSALLKEMINYAKTRYGIITCTVKRLISISPEFTELLLLISLIDSQDIPKELLKLYKSKTIVDEFIRHMGTCSLVSHKVGTDQQEPSLSIHRNTQQIIFLFLNHVLSPEKKKHYFDEIIQLIESYYIPAIESFDIPKLRRFSPHLHALLAHAEILDTAQKGTIELLLGCEYGLLGDPVKSKEFLDSSLKQFSTHYGDTPHPRLLRALTYAGIAEKDSGNYARAKELLETSVKLHDETKSSNKLDLALALRHLFYAYRSLAEFDKAKAVIERSIDIYTKLDPNNINLALAYADLASVYHDGSGDYEQAIHYRAKSLAMLQKLCGSEHMKPYL